MTFRPEGESMELGELLQRMQRYGLEEGEAHVYFHLSRLGASRAAAVAQAANRLRTDTYRLLDRLVEKGFAEKSLERPARYIPRPPEEALRRALEARRGQLEQLDAERAAVAASWPRPHEQAEPARQRFAVHQGRQQVNGLLARMVEGAREEIMLATSGDGLAHLDGRALEEALRAKAEAGVLVRVLAKRGRGGELPLSGLQGGQVRYADLPTFYQALLVDSREIALFVDAGKGMPGSDDTMLWLNSAHVVLAQKALFDHAWTQALSRSDLQDPKGPRRVEVLRGRWVRNSRLKEMVLGAQSSIQVRAPAREVALWKRHGVLDALARRAAEGVPVLLRLPEGSPPVPGATVVPADGAGGLVAVADGWQVLLALGTADSDAALDDEDWAIWSTRPGTVELLGPEWSAGAAPPSPAAAPAVLPAVSPGPQVVRQARTDES